MLKWLREYWHQMTRPSTPAENFADQVATRMLQRATIFMQHEDAS